MPIQNLKALTSPEKCLVKRKKCPEFSFAKFKSSRRINTEHLSFDLMDERNIKFRFTITTRIIFNDKNTGNRREALQLNLECMSWPKHTGLC